MSHMDGVDGSVCVWPALLRSCCVPMMALTDGLALLGSFQVRWSCCRGRCWRLPHGECPTPCEGSCCVSLAHISAFMLDAKHSALCFLLGRGATPCPAGAQQNTRVSVRQADVTLLSQAAQVQRRECHLSGGWLTLHLCLSGPVSSQSSQVLPVRCCLLCDGMLAGWVSQAPAICMSFCMRTQDMLSGVLSLT